MKGTDKKSTNAVSKPTVSKNTVSKATISKATVSKATDNKGSKTIADSIQNKNKNKSTPPKTSKGSPKHIMNMTKHQIKQELYEKTKKTYLIDTEFEQNAEFFENDNCNIKKTNIFLTYDSDNDDIIFRDDTGIDSPTFANKEYDSDDDADLDELRRLTKLSKNKNSYV